jgi:hypothetical protein
MCPDLFVSGVAIHLGFHHFLDGTAEQIFESILDILGGLNVVFL